MSTEVSIETNNLTYITGRVYLTHQENFSWCQRWPFFVRGRHDELVSEGGVYADMWLQQQKAEEKEKHGSISDSVEEEKDNKWTEKWTPKNCGIVKSSSDGFVCFKISVWFYSELQQTRQRRQQ